MRDKRANGADQGPLIKTLHARRPAWYCKPEERSMTETIRPDICVIGAGTAGMQVAMQAAGFGVAAVLVDIHGGVDGRRMGSDALRAGRLPLAALSAAARRAHMVAQA